MLDALYVASTGMHAQQTNIEAISNNLSNVSTPGYKKSRVIFDDLIYREPVGQVSELRRAGQNLEMGVGIGVVNNSKIFTVGDLRATQSNLDLAIRGNGFIELELENGEMAYTRLGALQVNSDGYLEAKNGYRLSSNIQIPPDASEIFISTEGVVEVVAGADRERLEIGRIEIANFMSDSSLESVGQSLYLETEASGPAIYSAAGDNGAGTFAQGFVEASNVDLVEEMLELVIAQRAYSASSQVVRASDEMMQITNNLRR